MTHTLPAAVLVTADLMFASKASAAGERSGVTVDTVLSVEALWEKVGGGAPPLVILDLTTPRLEPMLVVSRLRELKPPATTIIAFGPHVQEALLAAATKAGCDLVLARGQFNAQFDELLRRYAQPRGT